MGVSTYIEGVIPADEEWRKHLDAWDACKAAGVTPPDELYDYFGLESEYQEPSRDGRVVEVPHGRFSDPSRDRDGFEVSVDRIPEHVKIIRFVRQA